MRGALSYLGDAERRISALRGDALGWAVMEQFAPHDTRTRRLHHGAALLLIAPAWLWALLCAAPFVYLGSFVGQIFVAAVLGAAAGLAGRVWLTHSLADQLRRPSEEATAEIHRALGEAARFMHEAGIDWVGEDPSVLPQPWLMLKPVRATLNALHAADLDSPPR